MRSFVLFLLLVALFAAGLPAQQRHWVHFTDRGDDARQRLSATDHDALGLSDRALVRRAASATTDAVRGISEADLPPAPAYIQAIEQFGARVIVASRWLNAVSVEADRGTLGRIAALPFVARIAPVQRFRRAMPAIDAWEKTPEGLSSYGLNYGNSLSQMEMIDVPKVHDLWIDGTDIVIGMLDNGYRWRIHEAMSTRKVRGEYDFINLDTLTENEDGDLAGQDGHGTVTFSTLGGYMPGKLIGPAFNADFYLAKTEKNGSETPIEEDYWVAGIEWLEGRGASIVSASLGYSDWDDGSGYSWSNGDFDGRTAVTTRAAVEAMRRGIVVVTAMGNDGSAPGTLIAPADADSIIAVGAVNTNGTIAGFSSRGPTSDQRIKPDVSAPGVSIYCANRYGTDTYEAANGTSLATPLAAGVAALVRSARPELTPVQVRDALRATADNAAAPDNHRGWGLVNAFEALLANGLVISTNPKIYWSGNATTVMAWVVSKNTVDANGVSLTYTATSVGRTVTVAMTRMRAYDGLGAGSGLYTATIPDLAEGTEVRFFIRGSDSRETRTSPYGADERTHRFAVGESRMVGAEHLLPADFALEESTPNPFTSVDGSMAVINYAVPLPGANVRLRLHDTRGRVLRTLADGWHGAGMFRVALGAEGLATGVYYYSLESGDRQIMRRLVVVK